MSYINLNPDLFIGSQELNRMNKFLSEKQNLMLKRDTKSWGILKNGNNQSTTSTNFLVEKNSTLLDGCVKIYNGGENSYALDKNCNLIVKEPQTGIAIPDDGNWYWIKIFHAFSSKEVGTVSVSTTGSLVGVNTKFTEVLRGLPDFPVSIKFIDSSQNTQEYSVVDVIDDTNAVISGTFVAESSKSYAVIGTFSPDTVINSSDKYIYRYDSCAPTTQAALSIIAETPSGSGIAPNKTSGTEFWIARVKNTSGDIEITDMRTEFHLYRWE